MNNQKQIRDRFKQYLDKKLNPNRAQEIVFSSGQKSRHSGFMSNYSQNSNLYDNASPQTLSTRSIDSSAFSFSNSTQRISRYSNDSSMKTVSMKKRLKKLKEFEDNVCSICLEPYRDRVYMSCKHSYCNQCLQQWLKSSSKCPYCRADCDYYIQNGEKYYIEQKEFEYEAPVQFEQGLDYQCYMCERTNEGDQVVICDRCQVYACHIHCDPRLRGVVLDDDEQWFCHFCS